MTEENEEYMEGRDENDIVSFRINGEGSSYFSTNSNTIRFSGSSWGSWYYPYTPNYYYYYTGPQEVERCQFCDAISHTTAEKCSRVESIEYFKDGTIKLIRFQRDS